MDFLNNVKAFIKKWALPAFQADLLVGSQVDLESERVQHQADSWQRDDREYLRRNQVDTTENYAASHYDHNSFDHSRSHSFDFQTTHDHWNDNRY